MAGAWPPIDSEVLAAIAEQARTRVSIDDRSGVLARFEQAFARRHNVTHALLTSSGTAALHSGYYALGLGPGSEVIVQDYTFFATATPLLQLGVVPVLADVTRGGELDLGAATRLITDATRALVITHMWGNPQDMRAARAWCDDHGLAMIEDCSHAHGAARDGVSVGQLADVACWSLQAQKIVAAGEGGILATPHREVYERANLLGHFGKRSMAEVRPESALHPYAESGLGLKYRAHPLGVAMAEVYLRRLDGWLARRRRNASILSAAIAGYPGLGELTPSSPDRTATFHAFVFTVDPEQCGFDRDLLLSTLNATGCEAFRPAAGTPLHELPAFIEPRSPVTTYRAPFMRCDLPISEWISHNAIRIAVPSDDRPESMAATTDAASALAAVLERLSEARLVG
jgi:perosamine synthetase